MAGPEPAFVRTRGYPWGHLRIANDLSAGLWIVPSTPSAAYVRQ
jgi:hypothetical protein